MLVDPKSSKKKQLNKWALVSHCHLTFYQWIYTSWVVSKLLKLQCNWKVQNHRHGLKKKLYTIYNFSPPKKNYLCIIKFLNAWGLVTGTAVLPDEKCLSFKTEVYCFYLCSVTIVSGPIFRIFVLRPYAKTERKLNVSLADLIRCCPFSQGHSGVFRFLEVFILWFVKTGTSTLLSFPNNRSDPAP